MSILFPDLSWWLWSGKKKEAKLQKGSCLISSTELKLLELDLLKFSSGGKVSSSRKVRRKKWDGSEGAIDREYDIVVVPSDGGCYSDCESCDSDWSIGWSEPHGSEFLSEDEIEDGFGVLVPCYVHGRGGKLDGGKKKVVDNVASCSGPVFC